MKAMNELETRKASDQDMVNYVEKAKYQEELVTKPQTTLNIRLKDLDKLNAQLEKAEVELASAKKTTKIYEDLITKKNIKTKQLLES